jgi:Ca2+-binding EF-hand superfamily protein
MFDRDNKGYLNREELRTACEDFGVKCDTEEELDGIFQEIDLNGTGRINPLEF